MTAAGPAIRPAAQRVVLRHSALTRICHWINAVCFFALVMSDEHELAATDTSGLVIDLVAEKHRLAGKKAWWWQKKFRGTEEAK